MRIQIEFSSDESSDPVGIHGKGSTYEKDSSVILCAANKKDAAMRTCRQVELPALWNRCALRSSIETNCSELTERRDKACGLLLKVFERFKMNAIPDFGGPTAVKTFNGVLKTGLSLRSKYGRD